MPESEASVSDSLSPAACDCAAWACAEYPAGSYFLVSPDGSVLSHHPACPHAHSETLAEDEFEILVEFEDPPQTQGELLAQELTRARAWASRWKALAKALHNELTATRVDPSTHDFIDFGPDPFPPEPVEKLGRTSGLRLRSMAHDSDEEMDAPLVAAGGEHKG